MITAYDSAGRIATVNDFKGITTYGYDGTDAAGKSEHRGLVTSLKATRGGDAGDATFTAAYGAEAALVVQTSPRRSVSALRSMRSGSMGPCPAPAGDSRDQERRPEHRGGSTPPARRRQIGRGCPGWWIVTTTGVSFGSPLARGARPMGCRT